MTSQLNVDTIVDKAGSGGTNVKIANTSVTVAEGGSATTTTVQGLCKFWTQTIGSGTVSNFDSFNSSGLTDNGTGDYTHTFTNAMSNNDYSAVGMAIGSTHSSHYNETNTLTTSFRQLVRSHTSDTDPELLSLQINGDLA